MSSIFSSKRFVTQLILIFFLFTLGTVIALGAPVALLLNRQTDQQLHALIDQSNQTTLALIENKAAQLQNLALLLMERPTLNQLVTDEGIEDQLWEYLDEFLENTPADSVLICQGNDVVAFAGSGLDAGLCASPTPEGLTRTEEQVWLVSSASQMESGSSSMQVIVGQEMGSILKEFHGQSGLDYFLFFEGKIIASNLESDDGFYQINVSPDLTKYETLSSEGGDHETTFMSTIIPLSEYPEFELIGLLDIESFTSLNHQFRNIIIGTVAAVSLIGAVIAIVVSSRISKPINQLAQSAAALREGDLSTPLSTSSNTWEITQLTNALEDARVSLKHSLYQLRKEKAWIEDLLDSIVEGLLTIDNQGRVTYASQSISDILGVEASAMLGRSVDRFFVSSAGEELFSHQIPAPNQSRRIPVIIEGKEILLSVSASEFVPPEAGNATRALVIRDVSNEERIHKLIGEFMANITHEFRTPLTALSASVELLIDQLPTLSNEEIEHLLVSLNIGIVNLQALIDNLIEAASIEAGRFKVNPKPVELNNIINDAIDTIRPVAQKHNVHIIPPKQKQSLLVMADRRRTVQALLNLLSNAVKHSPEKGCITIGTLILEGNVMVEVHDEGSGVPPDFQSHLFNRFISPDSEEGASDLGLGLGLSVVKAVIEAQHGEVGFRNKENQGALFWFTLPIVEGSK
jgi:PAS domain S-box-containing protein